jgi:glyoxylase-like metal-dependent hydrolase (beta-lactamase superfamily II)
MDLASHPDSAAYGRLEARSPLVRRLLAKNPSPFTFTGTGTFVVGQPGGTVAVIDPGPDDPAHIRALIDSLAGETVSHIVITHTHMDHSPAAPALKAATGAEIVGCAPLVLADDGPRADAGFDATYAPDRVLDDGECIEGPGWTLTAVATPGHTSNHLCFALEQEKSLFTGDHVMGWSTTVVAPPDGDMAAYMESLQKLLARDDAVYHPTHGEPVTEPQRFVKHLLAHRRQRRRHAGHLALREQWLHPRRHGQPRGRRQRQRPRRLAPRPFWLSFRLARHCCPTTSGHGNGRGTCTRVCWQVERQGGPPAAAAGANSRRPPPPPKHPHGRSSRAAGHMQGV